MRVTCHIHLTLAMARIRPIPSRQGLSNRLALLASLEHILIRQVLANTVFVFVCLRMGVVTSKKL